MNSATAADSIRARVVTAVWDDARHVAHLCAALRRYLPVRSSVCLCTPLVAAPPFPRALGLLQPGGLSTALIQRRRTDSAREQLLRLNSALEAALPEGRVPEVTGMAAAVRTLAARFWRKDDLLVVPQRLGPAGLLRRLFPDFRMRLVLASQVPTLFCGTLPPWERVVVIDTEDRASWVARRILARLCGRLGIPLEVVPPSGLSQCNEQPGRHSECVVLSLAARQRILRPSRLSRLLGSRTDACLLWP